MAANRAEAAPCGGRYGSISRPSLALMTAWIRVAAPSFWRALSM
jgi:hypothetical protein